MSGWESTWKIKEVIGIDIWLMNYPGGERERSVDGKRHIMHLQGVGPMSPVFYFLIWAVVP